MYLLVFQTQQNYEFAMLEGVCLKFCKLFDPREQCSAIQVLTIKVFIKVVRKLHMSLADVSVRNVTLLLLFWLPRERGKERERG